MNLIEGTLRCLSRMPIEKATARVIAEESNANLASISYHFGSKDNLVTAATIEGLDRWLAHISESVEEIDSDDARERFMQGFRVVGATRESNTPLTRTFITALARAQHNSAVRTMLAEGVHKTRRAIAELIGLGSDRDGERAGGVVLAMFYGLMIQALLDPDLVIEGVDLEKALQRLVVRLLAS
jgi:AcrR family transcriptional regulator